MKLVTIGPQGTNSHEVAQESFSNYEIIFKNTHEEVFSEAISKNFPILIPIKNSITGDITETIKLLSNYQYKILKTVDKQINHCIASRNKKINLSNIKKIYSHPQGIKQCSNFLKENLPNAELIESKSTAHAAMELKNKSDDSACICSEFAGEIYDLNVLAKKIQNEEINLSTFAIIAIIKT